MSLLRTALLASAGLLIAGTAAAQQVATKSPFTVTLGGSIRSDWAYISDDANNASDYESRFDARLLFTASATHENGLTYGFQARFRNNQEGVGNNTLGADYKYIFMEGGWGRVEIGDYFGAATAVEVIQPIVGIGQIDLINGYSNATGRGTGFVDTGNYSAYFFGEDSPDTKITYLSPKFAGFMAGISFTPEVGDAGRNIRRPKAAGDYSDLVELAVGYDNSFGDIGVKASASYSFADEKRNTVGDYAVYQIGAQVTYAGFAFGGQYFNNGETFLAPNDKSFGWGLGLTYEFGAFAVGASYHRFETEVGSGPDLTDTAYGIGGTYTLAPGLQLQADIVKFDAESAGNNEGTLVTFRTRLDF